MSNAYNRLRDCVAQIRRITDFVPEIAVVLGSGLGDFAEAKVHVLHRIPYESLTGFPVSTISGHAGQFLFGELGGKKLVLMQGRVHHYEGYSMEEVVLPIRVMGQLGAEILVLTNAAGGIREDLRDGSLMLLTDHISGLVPSPLRGENPEPLGPRFPDMTEVYDLQLRQTALNTAEKLGIPLKQGVYLQAHGPQYETPAEIRMMASWGADAVGMSTACEAIAARHMGMRVCGISCITNMAAGRSGKPLNHNEVKETANRVAKDFQALLAELCRGIAPSPTKELI